MTINIHSTSVSYRQQGSAPIFNEFKSNWSPAPDMPVFQPEPRPHHPRHHESRNSGLSQELQELKEQNEMLKQLLTQKAGQAAPQQSEKKGGGFGDVVKTCLDPAGIFTGGGKGGGILGGVGKALGGL